MHLQKIRKFSHNLTIPQYLNTSPYSYFSDCPQMLLVCLNQDPSKIYMLLSVMSKDSLKKHFILQSSRFAEKLEGCKEFPYIPFTQILNLFFTTFDFILFCLCTHTFLLNCLKVICRYGTSLLHTIESVFTKNNKMFFIATLK